MNSVFETIAKYSAKDLVSNQNIQRILDMYFKDEYDAMDIALELDLPCWIVNQIVKHA